MSRYSAVLCLVGLLCLLALADAHKKVFYSFGNSGCQGWGIPKTCGFDQCASDCDDDDGCYGFTHQGSTCYHNKKSYSFTFNLTGWNYWYGVHTPDDCDPATVPNVTDQCEGGWQLVPANNGTVQLEQSCYGAFSWCQGIGGYLTSIESSARLTQVKLRIQALLTGQTGGVAPLLWLGFKGDYSTSSWAWDDQTTFGYTNWASGYPANVVGTTCGAMQFSSNGLGVYGGWLNLDCNTVQFGAICYKPPRWVFSNPWRS